MSHPILITACILARDEERRIEDALKSLQGWTDEILVLDDGSTDRTAEIARQHGAGVIDTRTGQPLQEGAPPRIWVPGSVPQPSTAHRAPDPQPGGPGEGSVPQPSTINYQPSTTFDGLRNLVIPHAAGDWIFYLDADERVPPGLGPDLRRLVRERGGDFEALMIPFRHFFCGQWMQHCGWWPGYTRPQLLKKGRFSYNNRLHAGVQVDGRTHFYPCDDPDRAIVHYSYENLHHYLEKLNRYTDGESESLLADGGPHTWQAMLAHFVHDWQMYYERGRANRDGMHGFVLAFMSAFYRFASRAKLWDLRRQRGEAGGEPVPADLWEALTFMGRVWQEGAERWLSGSASDERRASNGETPALPPPASTTQHATRNTQHAASTPVAPTLPLSHSPTLPLLWRAPLLDPSGYADEARQFVLGLIEAGEEVAVAPERWGGDDPGLPPEARQALAARTVPADTPAAIYVHQSLPLLLEPSPVAGCNVARTMFETDRLPEGWAERLNRMDRIWVPSEFNRETFVRSGVDPEKLAVVPGCLDPKPFSATSEPWDLPGGEGREGTWSRYVVVGHPVHVLRAGNPLNRPYRFLSVFDWSLHKGWDVLLEAFAREFGRATPRAAPGTKDVELYLKVWSSNHYTLTDMKGQADALLRARVGRGLDAFPNIHLWSETIPAPALPRLYGSVDAFVLPTRGEGWCRPLMEAMASGLPTIATAWSGLTAFHDAEVGYPLKYRLEPVSTEGAREIPIYAGHCWAEPDREDLQRLLRYLVEHQKEASLRGWTAASRIWDHYSREAVAARLREELTLCRELARGKPRPAASRVHPGAAAVLPARAAPEAAGAGSGTGAPTQHPARSMPGPNTSTPQHPNTPTPSLPRANPLPHDPVEPVDFQAALGRPLRVRWEGDQTVLSSLARVNRKLCRELLRAPDVELSLWERKTSWHTLTAADDPELGSLLACLDRPLSGPPDVTVRHHFPPNWERPAHGRLVVMQPWEYGHLPQEWVAGAAQPDEVWAYSRFVRDVYVRSGVPAEKVRVLPLGFNPEVFTPDGPGFPLPTGFLNPEPRSLNPQDTHTPIHPHTPTVFLFVGGALERKGADLLLQAYLRAFTADDNVLLVVKDMGTRTFYQGQTLAPAFQELAAASLTQHPTPNTQHPPRVLYLDQDLSDAQLAALYRSATCLVLPYRGEGFALPPLEALACGVLPIVTGGGPTDDYLDDARALRLPARRRSAGGEQVGPFVCAGDPWTLEPDLPALVEALRWVRDHPEEARRRAGAPGERSPAALATWWSWSRAAGQVRARLLALAALAAAPASLAATLWAEPREERERPGAPQGAEDAESGRRLSRAERRRTQRAGRQAATPAEERAASEAPDGAAAPEPRPQRPTPALPRPAPAGPIELSLCMIVRDEEPRLRACLQSVRPHVDEMIVVDTGSTDRTREVARDCGARVFELSWPDSFAAARNASLEQAAGDWIFWLDADDVLPPECGEKLRALVSHHTQSGDRRGATPSRHPAPDTRHPEAAYQVQVRIPPGPGEFSEAVVDHVKLFPNRPDLRFEHRIHEQVLPSIRAAGLEVLPSGLHVVHQNYDRSEDGQAKKRRRDFRLLELDLRDHPEHPFVLFNLGMTYLHATKEYEVAAHYLRRSLDRSDPRDSIVRKAYALLTTARICQGEWELALRANEEGRRHYPEDAELLFQAGQLYQQVGRFAEGRQALERLVTGQEDPHYRSVDTSLREHRGRHELALLFRRLGDGAHCEQVLREILRAQPGYLPAQVDLVETLALLGRREEAGALLRGLPAAPGLAREVERLRRGLGLA